MGLQTGTLIETTGLLLALDSGVKRSYAGEPTTNSDPNPAHNVTDVVLWSGSYLERTWFPNVITPLGKTGATLCKEGNSQTEPDYRVMTRYGGGGFGTFTISAYVKPIGSLNTLGIGMLASTATRFDFRDHSITKTSVAKNPIMEKYSSGWWRIGVDVGGRTGGWVGGIGITGLNDGTTLPTYTPNTGTTRGFFIAGVQYEIKQYVTPWVETSRSGINGFKDISGNKNSGDISAMAFDFGNMKYDGTGYTNCGTINLPNNAFTIELVFKWDDIDTSNAQHLFAGNNEELEVQLGGSGGTNGLRFIPAGLSESLLDATSFVTSGTNIIHCTWDGTIPKIYKNGIFVISGTSASPVNVSGNQTVFLGKRTNNTNYFKGTIDIIKLYNNALNADKIYKNYINIKNRYQ